MPPYFWQHPFSCCALFPQFGLKAPPLFITLTDTPAAIRWRKASVDPWTTLSASTCWSTFTTELKSRFRCPPSSRVTGCPRGLLLISNALCQWRQLLKTIDRLSFFIISVFVLQLWGETRAGVPDPLLQVWPQQHLHRSAVLLRRQPLHQTRLHAADPRPAAPTPSLLDHPRGHRGRVPPPPSPDSVSHGLCGQRAEPKAQPQLHSGCEGPLGAQCPIQAVERGGELRLLQRAELCHAWAAASEGGEALPAPQPGPPGGGAFSGGHPHGPLAEALL